MKNSFFLKIITYVISIIDSKNKKKIVNFFKKFFSDKYLNIVDVGAHRGETIEFFVKNFKINQILAFEPNLELLSVLKKYQKLLKKKLTILNIGLGEKKESKKLSIMSESSSSTINELNTNTQYYKRKKKLLSIFLLGQGFFKKKETIEIDTLSNILKKIQFKEIDILKIDTEGYELNVLKGISDEDFKKIRFIYFEHHFDTMIKKNYNFSDINSILKKNNFSQRFKLRMSYRKSFEYIYENSQKIR